jgi:hydroxymethylglutaryl-CoA synthase
VKSPGIVGFGAYVPRLRLERKAIAEAHAWFNPSLMSAARGTRAIACWDEDVITMGVEAARRCMQSFDGAPAIDVVMLASTTHTFADRQNSVLVKEAINLPDTTRTVDLAGGRRAGMAALLGALSSAGAQQGLTLCIAAEKCRTLPASEAELEAGDGAAAVLVGTERILARLLGSHSVSVDFVDKFRAAGGEFEYAWESRWVREEGYGKIAVDTVRAALAGCALDAQDIKHFAMPVSTPGGAVRVARALGITAPPVGDELQTQIGMAGAAQPLLLLAHCLERAKPGEKIVVVGFGQGCDVVIFEATQELASRSARPQLSADLAQGKHSANYLQYLVFNRLLEVDRGMRAEMDQKTALTGLYRDRKTVLGLVGARDPRSGKKQFPRSEISVHPDVEADSVLEDYPFADKLCRIVTFTADRLAYSINPPTYYGMIEFDGGGRMVAEFADLDGDDLVVGREMCMRFRIKALDEQRGFVRYFWKATPLRTAALNHGHSAGDGNG